ncbi:hypothetical protein N8787_00950 [Opitutaceae bacterium]|nr:hypothetical protein [Opitutaceae bacterium]
MITILRELERKAVKDSTCLAIHKKIPDPESSQRVKYRIKPTPENVNTVSHFDLQ